MKEREVPVYLFLGFLESGKTTFIQETMEDIRFDSGEKTLLLVLEEGEVEYDTSRFAVKDYAIEVISAEEFSPYTLHEAVKKHQVERVVVEYNGMKMIEELFEAMPNGWLINQVMTFFDSRSFMTYNQNMRQLVFDKIQYTDMVIFNRFEEGMNKEELHKIVRGISRRTEIVYEHADGRAEYDEIEDPLPFDIDAPIVEIADGDYAFFYRDLMEEMQKYRGKTVHFKGLVATDKRLKDGTFVLGRHVMTCCEADIAYSGMVCIAKDAPPVKTRDWVEITARIDLEYHSVYEQLGPVLKVKKLIKTTPPEQELATFY